MTSGTASAAATFKDESRAQVLRTLLHEGQRDDACEHQREDEHDGPVHLQEDLVGEAAEVDDEDHDGDESELEGEQASR